MNWIGVGYFNNHIDKKNTFQLLIVQREDTGNPGDFDIIFNYEQIQWETGDASGGSGGLGGSSARAGFSNGSGAAGTSYEIPGSGINGAFLDSSPSGLAKYREGDAPVGRYVFRMRGGAAPATKYVALGDSFQSGEGAKDYQAGTDTSSNKCHRSDNAYPQQLVDGGWVNLDLDFGACSGAVIGDLAVTQADHDPPYDDGISQLDRLDTSTKLVTIGIGGNGLDFGGIITTCVTAGSSWWLVTRNTCENDQGGTLQENFVDLAQSGALESLYKDVRLRAPYARIMVLGYPRFFVEGSVDGIH